MEIINTTSFNLSLPPEAVKTFYLYMTDDPRMRPNIYFSYSAGDQNAACDYLGSFNMPMKCTQIKSTESEALAYREKLEKERHTEWEKHFKEQNGQKTN
jgi:hypothetical protein